MAPEVLIGEQFLKKSDIFSMGCILYESITGRQPFINVQGKINMLKLINSDYEKITPDVDQFSEVVELCHSMLRAKPEERPSVEDVLERKLFKEAADKKENDAILEEVKRLREENKRMKKQIDQQNIIPSVPQNQNSLVTFLPNPKQRGVIINENMINFTWNEEYTMFIDRELRNEIVRIEMKIVKHSSFGYAPEIGVALKSEMPFVHDCFLNNAQNGTCMVIYSTKSVLCLNTAFIASFNIESKENDVLAMEINLQTRRVYWFVNGFLIPHCVTHIPPGVYIGISGRGNKCQILSFSTLSSCSVHPSSRCSEYMFIMGNCRREY